MSTTNLVLLLWAAACIAIGYAAGRYWQASKFWTWVDPIYYPLAIAGIVLLFFSNDATRILVDLRDRLADTEQQIADNKTAQPPSSAAPAAISAWTAQQAKLEADLRATEAKIANLQKPKSDTVFQWIVSFVLSHLWPFVLVFALTLKFAKGVAGHWAGPADR
jgi:hypothetical protein